MHLHRADANVPSARLDAKLVALADRARPERPGDDGADAAQREDAVDVEPRRSRRRAGDPAPSAARASASRSSSRPAPVFALTATTSAPGTSSRASSSASSSVSASTVSAFVTATTPCSTPRRRRIARCSCVCGRAPSPASIDEQEEIDPGGTGHHGAHEAFVTRHVDEREPPARRAARAARSRDRSRCRAAAPRAAGRCPFRSALARATSCRGRYAPPCRRSAARPACHASGQRRTALAPRDRPRRRRCVRQSSSRRPSRTMPIDRRLAEPERRGELLLDRAREALELGERQRAAADAGDGLLDLPADELRQPLGTRPDHRRAARRACAAPGSRAARAPGRGRARASPRGPPA